MSGDRLVGPSELAEALDVSERHVYRLHRLGMPKQGRGEYPLARCAAWYRTHVLSPNGDGDAPDLGEARLRKERARALEAERKLARRREEVVPAEVWDRVTDELAAWIRETVLGFARPWAEAAEGMETPQEVASVLRERVREGMEVLQEGPPAFAGDRREGETDERAA